jgi:hypothetical protein
MADAPINGDKRTGTPARAQPRAVVRSRRERRRALIIGCGMLLTAAVTTVAVVAAQSLIAGYLSRAPQIAMGAPDSDLQTARITKDSGGKGCWQEFFDNRTGRVTRSAQPCEATAYDSNGMPVPVGTIHRLDAISKSFPGR